MIILNYLNIRHTNIVYRVKTCYKIKIDSRGNFIYIARLKKTACVI